MIRAPPYVPSFCRARGFFVIILIVCLIILMRRFTLIKKLLLLLLAAVIIAVGAACSVSAPGPVVDDLGRTIDVEKVPQKIVSLAPSNTEILFALGLGDKVVGVTDFDDYPAQVKQKTSVGSPYPGFDLEKIVSLEPDLVLGFGYSLPDYAAKLEKLGHAVVVLAPKDVEGVLSDIELVGKITGSEEAAKRLVDNMKRRIDDVVAKTKDAPKPKVFWEFDATDSTKPWTAGPGSFNHALIELAGGQNIGATGASSSFQMSAEEIISDDPGVIFLGDYQFGAKVEDVLNRPGWSVISAVKNNRIYPITDPNLTDRPGPRIVDGLEMLAKMLHPELFK